MELTARSVSAHVIVEDKVVAMDIKDLLNQDYLDKFKIYPEVTLFPPVWEALKEQRCPLCSNKLKFPLKGNVILCSSKKHNKPFIITVDRYLKFINK